jgi:hypothetical protein
VRTSTRISALAAAALVAAACTGSGATASPSAAPTPTPSPSPSAAGADFTIEVLPAEDPVEGRPAIPGQKVSFLVVVTSPGNDEPVTITATATGAKVTEIKPAELKPGVVGEVWVVPDAATEEATISTDITATRGGVVQTEKRTTRIMPFEDDRAEQAQPYFDMWVDWLAANHPEFGISKSTKWDSSYVMALLIVSHYAYFSDEWEMKVSWHVMIAPDDFTEVYLRHRGTDTTWTHAFRMDSFTNKTTPKEITPDPFMR